MEMTNPERKAFDAALTELEQTVAQMVAATKENTAS